MTTTPPIPRREFLARLAVSSAALGLASSARPVAAATNDSPRLKLCLTPGSIGVQASQSEAIALAQRHGFDAVEPYPDHLARLSAAEMDALLAELKAKGLVWGAAGLQLDFRRDDDAFKEGLRRLPTLAAAMQRAGVTRVGTWLMPGHDALTYLQNFRRHADRLRETARVLRDHALRLGLEYVGTFTARTTRRFPFVHNLAETRELLGEIGTDNVGVVLDSWHWWQADDTVADLESLRPTDIVSVDLNDAPAGTPKNQQQDGRRELPAATGVINIAAFLKALIRIGYDGPVRAEPFNRALNELDNDAACAATAAAMKKAFALAGQV